MSQEDTIELLEELLTSVRQRGYKKTINLLKTNTGIESLVLDEYQQKVIGIIAEEFAITLEDIVSSRYMRGENKYAVGFCVHYLYSRYTLGEIQKNIFKNKGMILELNKNEKVSEIKRIIEIKEQLDKKIQNV